MNKLVYLFEMDSVRSTDAEVKKAQEVLYEELVTNGNTVVLSFNQLTDSRAFLAILHNTAYYNFVQEQFAAGRMRFSRYKDFRTASQYVQNTIMRNLDASDDHFIYSALPVKSNQKFLLELMRQVLVNDDIGALSENIKKAKAENESVLALFPDQLAEFRAHTTTKHKIFEEVTGYLETLKRFLQFVITVSMSDAAPNPAIDFEKTPEYNLCATINRVLQFEPLGENATLWKEGTKPINCIMAMYDSGREKSDKNNRSNWHSKIRAYSEDPGNGYSRESLQMAELIVDLCHNYTIERSIHDISRHYGLMEDSADADAGAGVIKGGKQGSFRVEFFSRLDHEWQNGVEASERYLQPESNEYVPYLESHVNWEQAGRIIQRRTQGKKQKPASKFVAKAISKFGVGHDSKAVSKSADRLADRLAAKSVSKPAASSDEKSASASATRINIKPDSDPATMFASKYPAEDQCAEGGIPQYEFEHDLQRKQKRKEDAKNIAKVFAMALLYMAAIIAVEFAASAVENIAGDVISISLPVLKSVLTFVIILLLTGILDKVASLPNLTECVEMLGTVTTDIKAILTPKETAYVNKENLGNNEKSDSLPEKMQGLVRSKALKEYINLYNTRKELFGVKGENIGMATASNTSTSMADAIAGTHDVGEKIEIVNPDDAGCKVICEYEVLHNKQIGVLYKSKYNMLVVDLVKGKGQQEYYTYERIVPTVKAGAVVMVTMWEGKFVLIRQFRHAIRRVQTAFPRGYGEEGRSAEENVKKELMEELGVEPQGTPKLMGEVVADSGLSTGSASVWLVNLASLPPHAETYSSASAQTSASEPASAQTSASEPASASNTVPSVKYTHAPYQTTVDATSELQQCQATAGTKTVDSTADVATDKPAAFDEGILDVLMLTEEEMNAAIAKGKIDDGYTLAAMSLYKTSGV